MRLDIRPYLKLAIDSYTSLRDSSNLITRETKSTALESWLRENVARYLVAGKITFDLIRVKTQAAEQLGGLWAVVRISKM